MSPPTKICRHHRCGVGTSRVWKSIGVACLGRPYLRRAGGRSELYVAVGAGRSPEGRKFQFAARGPPCPRRSKGDPLTGGP
jgi:hypothetical protein